MLDVKAELDRMGHTPVGFFMPNLVNHRQKKQARVPFVVTRARKERTRLQVYGFATCNRPFDLNGGMSQESREIAVVILRVGRDEACLLRLDPRAPREDLRATREIDERAVTGKFRRLPLRHVEDVDDAGRLFPFL